MVAMLRNEGKNDSGKNAVNRRRPLLRSNLNGARNSIDHGEVYSAGNNQINTVGTRRAAVNVVEEIHCSYVKHWKNFFLLHCFGFSGKVVIYKIRSVKVIWSIYFLLLPFNCWPGTDQNQSLTMHWVNQPIKEKWSGLTGCNDRFLIYK